LQKRHLRVDGDSGAGSACRIDCCWRALRARAIVRRDAATERPAADMNFAPARDSRNPRRSPGCLRSSCRPRAACHS